MIRDCYYPDMQAKLNAGIQEIAVEGKRALGGTFEQADQTQRESVLSVYDATAAADESHFFRTLKELTMLGYFTSEEAAADGVLNYNPVPTRYDGCAPVDENTKVFYSNI